MISLQLDSSSPAGPCSCSKILDRSSIRKEIKAAGLKVAPSVVSVITHNLPDDMILHRGRPILGNGTFAFAFAGSGIIIQSEDAGDGTYFGTILAPAYLFKRTNDLPPEKIQVDVRLSGGKLCKGGVLACDFHFNIAAIEIRSDSPLKPASISHLSDTTLGTKIIIAERACDHDYEIVISTGVFSACARSKMPCKELFWIEGSADKCYGGGAVLNYNGEVIGICFGNVSFLPFNLVSRWWDHFKSFRECCRPYLGVEVAIPKTVTGVVVRKVEKNSPAHRFGLKRGDVIKKFDGVSIRSKLEFFESVWDNAGKVVELKVVKASDGVASDVSMIIEETPRDKLYEWKLPGLVTLPTASACTSRAHKRSYPLRECSSRAHKRTMDMS